MGFPIRRSRSHQSVLDAHSPKEATDLETVLNADAWAREEARVYCQSPRQAISI